MQKPNISVKNRKCQKAALIRYPPPQPKLNGWTDGQLENSIHPTNTVSKLG